MNRRQRVFLRESGRTASVLADFLENEMAECPEGALPSAGRAVWRSMICFGKAVCAELTGILGGLSSEDCFEVSDWFEYVRRTYGKRGEILTLCQILCCALRMKNFDKISGVLRIFSRAVELGSLCGKPPDMIPVWIYMVENRDVFFRDEVESHEAGAEGTDVSCGRPEGRRDQGDRYDGKAVRRRMIGQLCCCAGEDRQYLECQRLFFGFMRAELEGTEERETIMNELRPMAAEKGIIRLFLGLESAFYD